MPRKTRTARLFRAFGRVQERAELVELLVAERSELRHHVVAELRRVLDVRGEALDAEPALADRGPVRRAEVGAASAEVPMARRAPQQTAAGCAGPRVLDALEGLPGRPGRN